MKTHGPRQARGFTLLELLISLSLGALLVSAVTSTYITVGRMMDSTRVRDNLTANMQVAMDFLSRDLTMTGYGIPRDNLPKFREWVHWPEQELTIPFSDDPTFIDGKKVLLVGAFERPAVLQASAKVDDSHLVVSSNAFSAFQADGRRLIFIGGKELARVTEIAGTTLRISTHHEVEEPLRYNHDRYAPIDLVQVITYRVTTFNGRPVLSRRDILDKNTPLPDTIVAFDIVDMETELDPTTREIKLTLHGRSSEPDQFQARRTGGKNPYRESSMTTTLFMRNPTSR